MLISSYIIVDKSNTISVDPLEVAMKLDFSDISEKIEQDESHFTSKLDNISFMHSEVKDIYGKNRNLSYAYHDGVTAYDNSLETLLIVRKNLINEYLRKGYKVYQYNFTPDINGQNSTGYRSYDINKGIFVPYQLDKVERLSPIWIPSYRKGEIESLLAAIGPSNKNTSTGSITISSSSAGKSASRPSSSAGKSNGSGSGSGSTAPLGTVCATNMSVVSYAEQQAKSSGNNLQAWNKLIEACEYYFTYCGTSNLYVNQVYKQAKGHKDQQIQMLAEGAEAFVKDVFTANTTYGFGYSGLHFKPEEYNDKIFQKITFQVSRVHKGVNIMGELGYVQSPNYIVRTETHDNWGNRYIKGYDTMRHKGAYFSFGVGPSIGFFKRHVVINSLAQLGYHFGKKNYEDEDGFTWLGSLSVGAIVRLGKLGFGIDYHYMPQIISMQKDDIVSPVLVNETVKVHQKYKNWETIGVRVLFNFKPYTKKK